MTAGEAGGDELGVGRRRRVTRQLLIGVPLVTAWAIFAVKGPAWLIERADKSSSECLDDAYAAKRDPSGCALGTGFAIARWFPEVREHAKAVERSFRQRRAERTFDFVMASKPSAAHRDAAAVQLVADSPVKVVAAAHAARAGVFGPLKETQAGSGLFSRDANPAFAAVALGDFGAARAALAHGDPRGFEVVQLAALACLLGDHDRGQALLKLAAATREAEGTPDPDLRITAAHCGSTLASVGFDPVVTRSFLTDAAAVARLFDPKVQVGHRRSFATAMLRDSTILPSVAYAEVALAAGGDDEPSPLALLAAIRGESVRDVSLRVMFDVTPWPVPSTSSYEFMDYAPPAWFALAASRYAHAAEIAPAHIADERRELDETAAQHPRETLLDATKLMYEFEAGYLLRRGDRSGARGALDPWRALDPADFRRAPLETAAGDPAAALATCDAWQTAQRGDIDAEVARVVAINRVFALTAQGKHKEAFAIAKGLKGTVGEWLALATAISSGAPLDSLSLTAKESPNRVTPAALLSAIKAQQAVHDDGFYLDDDKRAVLPAVMVAIARAAQAAGEDPEVVLDQAFALHMPSRTVALARAEAARWRNDSAAAETWERRAASIASLYVNDDALVLAGVAGLW